MNCAAFIVACVIAQPGNAEEANPPSICGPGQISAYVCQHMGIEYRHLGASVDQPTTTFDPRQGYEFDPPHDPDTEHGGWP